MNKFDQKIREELGFASYALTLYVSAKSGQRVDKILPLADFYCRATESPDTYTAAQ